MLSGNCTEALSIQANVTISGSGAKLINNDIAPLPFPLPALLKQYWYTKRGERVRVRGHAPFYATLGFTSQLTRSRIKGALSRAQEFSGNRPGLTLKARKSGAKDTRTPNASRLPNVTRFGS